MNLFDLFESNRNDIEEGYKVVPGIDHERYTDLSHEGLEGPFSLKSGKVVYYDPKVGKYYDRDSDMYMSHDEYAAHELDEKLGSSLVNRRQSHALFTKFKKPKVNFKEEDDVDEAAMSDKHKENHLAAVRAYHAKKKADKEQRQADSRGAFNNWMGGSPEDQTDFMNIRKKGVSEGATQDKINDDNKKNKRIYYNRDNFIKNIDPRLSEIAVDHENASSDGQYNESDEGYWAGMLRSQEFAFEMRAEEYGIDPNLLYTAIKNKTVAEGRFELDRKSGQMRHNKDDADQRHGLYINSKLVKTCNSREEAENVKKRDAKFKDATVKKIAEGAKVDRMVKHIASSEKKAGKSAKDAENIAWATANKRGYLDNKNKKKHVEEADEVTELKTPKIQKVRPGATADESHNGWNLRYQLRPKEGEKEFKGMAVHSKSSKTKPISVVGSSPEDVLEKLKTAIDTSRGTNEIKSKRVTVDFNAQLARDVIGHGGDIYAEIINHNGQPVLLLSSENQGGMTLAQDRTALVNRRPDRVGQQAFGMSGAAARAAGLTHARYSLGRPIDYMPGVIAMPLEFRSEVYPGEAVKMGEPGVTIAHPRNETVAQEGSMSAAAHHPSGAKFGGYYKGTQKGAPRPGQGFGSMEEGIAGNMKVRSDPLTKLKKPEDLKMKAADPYKGMPNRNNLVSAQARNLVAKGAQTAGPGTGSHKNKALDVKKGLTRNIKHKGKFDFSESSNFLTWAISAGYNVISNPAVYEDAKRVYTNLIEESKKKINEDKPDLKPGQYYIWTVYFDDGTSKRIKIKDEKFDVTKYYADKNQVVVDVDYNWQVHN
jgi:hypothetical protein